MIATVYNHETKSLAVARTSAGAAELQELSTENGRKAEGGERGLCSRHGGDLLSETPRRRRNNAVWFCDLNTTRNATNTATSVAPILKSSPILAVVFVILTEYAEPTHRNCISICSFHVFPFREETISPLFSDT